jgi:hypothetical protein
MTPLDQVLSQAVHLHGAALTAYSIDRGDPLATTTPIRPRTLGTELRTELAQSARLPYATRFKISGAAQREQIGELVVRHHPVAFLGASLGDRSRQVALRVMGIAATGMAAMALLITIVVYSWVRERTVAGPTVAAPKELPAGGPEHRL